MALLKSLLQSIDIYTVLLCVTVFVLVSWLVKNRLLTKNHPPGPTHWPIVGCIPELLIKRKLLYELFEELSNKYGPVCLISAPFGQRAVIISGCEALREALSKPEFDERPHFIFGDGDDLSKGKGILASTGEHWQVHRRFSLTVLRSFGVGKRSFEDQIATESQCMMKEIQSFRGKPFDPTHLFCNAVSNVICSVVFAKRFEYDDGEFARMLFLLEDSVAHIGMALLSIAIPFLRKIPYLPSNGFESMAALRLKLKSIVDQHHDTFDKENLRDFIDVYINHTQEKREQGVETLMNDIDLIHVVNDFFLAGTETTSTTLRWALLYMMKYPDVQKRVQEEIDAVVSRDRLPQISDKPNLPYTEAVIHEIQRYGAIVFFGGIRYSRVDVEFRGYFIPKGTYILSNMRTATRDPTVWDDPEVFNPERFLDDEGRVKKMKEGMVFGSGPRACLGEQLARMELFIFFTHLMHRFTFKKPSDVGDLNLKPYPGSILSPYPYNICAIERS